MPPLDIAIAGAGPGGLATALYLHRAGHRVTLFERFETPHPVGSGLMMQPTGLAVMADLGLHGRIAALGRPIDGLIGHDARTGRVVLDVKYAALPRVRRGLGTHRAALFNVLHEAVLAEGIPIRTGFTVSGRDGGWLLGGAQREGPFELIVDTLGAGSPLRAQARVPGTSRALAFGALWATTPWVDGFDRRALTQRYRNSDVMIGILPIGRQVDGGQELAAFFWSLKASQYESVRAAGFEALAQTIRRHWPETAPHLDAIGGFDRMTLAKYAHATLVVPAGEGIAFVGDSAHSTSPQLGQGANMALLDAKALAVALEGSVDVPAALERYARLRRWHVRLYQMLSWSLTPFYQSDSTALPLIRDLFVSYLARIPPAPQFLAALVAGNLLSPIKALGLKPAPELEDR
jgi:2-polyprenyl-6-methoxyphenol hydroxylase-like FAD-dependent oxidoreductase